MNNLIRPDRNFCVYFIYCPLDGKIRYIGSTCNPEVRFRQHEIASNTFNRDLNEWLLFLYRRELMPVFRIIERNIPLSQLAEIEKFWIQSVDQYNGTLFNKTFVKNKNNFKTLYQSRHELRFNKNINKDIRP